MESSSFLDWPFFTDEHRALAHELDDWAARKLAPVEVVYEAGYRDLDATCRHLVELLATGGWLRHAVPAAHGGAREGLDVRSLCLIRQLLARRFALADFAFAMQGLGAGAITLFGSEALRARYLPDVAAGKAVAGFALSEPDAGSDVAALATEAEPVGDGFVLRGTKTWISNGGVADFYVVFARTGEGPGARGLSAFVVEADNPGLRVTDRIEVIAPHPLATLVFEDCLVPADALVGQSGRGFQVAMATLDVFRSTVGAAALGLAESAMAEALDRAGRRKMFGGVLGDLPLAQAMLADMATAIDAAALLVYRAAWTKDQGAERVTREAAMAKLYATEAAQQVIDQAVQLSGALGVKRGTKVEGLYREVRALRIYEGASEVQKLVIARQVLAAARRSQGAS
ncbi:acyl-CoA dehydrogenase family protein [Haliangium sp.]|uniref:acyl-CoA dehydrogenase family protein n=1 Tax=Haliangium sp. TaxID=2663208 RepID=UPI003D0CAE53